MGFFEFQEISIKECRFAFDLEKYVTIFSLLSSVGPRLDNRRVDICFVVSTPITKGLPFSC